MNSNPQFLDVALPNATLIESSSTSTFLPEEDASICPLLQSSSNSHAGTTTPLVFSHPLTPCDIDSDGMNQNGGGLRHANGGGCGVGDDDGKADETSSTSGSSSGIVMDVPENPTSSLFNKHSAYQHLHMQNNNVPIQDGNGHLPNGNSMSLSTDTPSFVKWNWPLIRKCTFFVFMSSLLAMCAVVVALIVTLPKTCNPQTEWYKGRVFYEIFPASFQDSNNDGVGDLRGIGNRIEYLVSLGVSAVRLNSIFATPNYPDDHANVSSLLNIADVLGKDSDLRQLVESLHLRNISFLLDLPVQAFIEQLTVAEAIVAAETVLDTVAHEIQQLNSTLGVMPAFGEGGASAPTSPPLILPPNPITLAIRKWSELGVDGFYLKGLEGVMADVDLAQHLAEWKSIIGTDRILIVNEATVSGLSEEQRVRALPHLSLVDVLIDPFHGAKRMNEHLLQTLNGYLAPEDNGIWIQWSVGGIAERRSGVSSSGATAATGALPHKRNNANFTLALTIMQLMLPGTPNIFYGDEIALEGLLTPGVGEPPSNDTQPEHLQHLATMPWPNASKQFTSRDTLPWLPHTSSFTFENFELVSNMIELRKRSPSLYKNSICKVQLHQPNTEIRRSHDDILIVERFYPRRNSFVSVSNYGGRPVTMDMTSTFYSGKEMLHQTPGEKIYFSHFRIGPTQTIVVKLDK